MRALECGGRAPSLRPVGLAEIDGHFQGGGLPIACLHHVGGEAGPATALALRFADRLSAPERTQGPLVWIAAVLEPFGPGLARQGVAASRLILARAERSADRLWAFEEALRTPGVAAAVAELPGLDLTAGRRLQLAAEAGGVTGILLSLEGAAIPAGVAMTRWHVAAEPSADHPLDPRAPGRPFWRLTLERARNASPHSWRGDWFMEEDDDALFAASMPLDQPTDPLHRPDPAVDRPAAPPFPAAAGGFRSVG
ncbi:MAG: ImuA family protein [Elsteraceae bacterium]